MVLIQQVAGREWAPAAIHDTVQAALHNSAFQRSVRNSLADRLLIALVDFVDRVGRAMKHLPSGRSIGLGVVALLVIFLAARLVIAARNDEPRRSGAPSRRRIAALDEPWLAADTFMREGQYEAAAHALYRGVLLALGQAERLRLDPSKTSGDYARELRRRGSTHHDPFRAFTRRFDDIAYGHVGATEGAVRELLDLSAPFRPRALAA